MSSLLASSISDTYLLHESIRFWLHDFRVAEFSAFEGLPAVKARAMKERHTKSYRFSRKITISCTTRFYCLSIKCVCVCECVWMCVCARASYYTFYTVVLGYFFVDIGIDSFNEGCGSISKYTNIQWQYVRSDCTVIVPRKRKNASSGSFLNETFILYFHLPGWLILYDTLKLE